LRVENKTEAIQLFGDKNKTEAPQPFEDENETETRPFGDKNSTDLTEESELSKLKTIDKEGIITEAMSEEVEWALSEKKRHEAQAEKTETDSESHQRFKDSESHQSCDNHRNEEKTESAEKSEDVLEKERQRKVSEENAKRAEKLRLENLMRLVQEKIDKARKEKEKRLSESLEQ